MENVLEAEDGAQAETLVRESTADLDLVALDLNMPNIDGIQFLRSLKELEFGGELVIVSGENASALEVAENLAGEYNLRLRSFISNPLT